jgi:hypothetical protein
LAAHSKYWITRKSVPSRMAMPTPSGACQRRGDRMPRSPHQTATLDRIRITVSGPERRISGCRVGRNGPSAQTQLK